MGPQKKIYIFIIILKYSRITSNAIDKINIDQFNINIQSDASEFLLCFFELIENNLEKINYNLYKNYNNKKLYEYLFNCNIISEITCLETNEKFTINESEKFLTLPIPKAENININNCLEEYLKIEK